MRGGDSGGAKLFGEDWRGGSFESDSASLGVAELFADLADTKEEADPKDEADPRRLWLRKVEMLKVGNIDLDED